jgi:hypothetical protein
MPFDAKRTLAMGSFSACFGAGVYVPFYYALDKYLGPRRVLTKTFLDCGLMASLVDVPLWFAWTGLVEGRTVQGSLDRVREQYRDTMIATWILWVPVTIGNFALVPLPLRVPLGFCAEFVWAVAASFLSHRGDDDSHRRHTGSSATAAVFPS